MAGAGVAIVIIVAIVLATGDDSGKRSSSTTTTSTSVPPTSAATDPPSPTTTLPEGFATPEDAIEDYLEDKGYEYAGDCAGTDLETDVGKWCSIADSGMDDPDPDDNTRIYFIGPTFSEGAEELTLTRGSDGKWRVTASEPTPPVGG